MSTGKVERSESVDIACPVCHDPYEVFAIGPCDHPVCYRCSTRMRVLCEQNDCPICRSLMPQVAFVYERSLFKNITLRECIPNRKFKIFFEDEEVEERYLELLVYRCKLCRNRNADKSFNQLQTHMRREHQLFACDLCVSHIKIFPFERKFYSRKDLALHRRVGDPDDKSYKGHPLCEFCDTRYNDKDELLKHLRKDHYFCHFCDQHCSNTYYDQYPDLMKHFSESHFLCTEDECGNPTTRFTHAFVSDIDLKAHKASEHNKNLSKAQVREARTIELDFQLAPRRQAHGRGAGITSNDYEDSRSGNGGRRGGDRYNRRRERDDEDLQRAIEASKESMSEARPPVQERVPDPVHDFPSLSGAPVPASMARPPPSKFATPRSREEDFPTLSSTSKGGKVGQQPPNKAYASVMNFQNEVKPAVPVKKESKPVSLGSVPSVSRDRWSASAPKNSEEDYPALGGSRPSSGNPTPNVNTVNWINKPSHATVPGGSTTQTAQISNKSSRYKPISDKTINDVNEFPTLGGVNRNQNVRNNLFSEWSKPQNNNKKKPTPKSKKFDESFELPSNYCTPSDEYPVINDNRIGDSSKKLVNGVAHLSVEPKLTNGSHDFPELPTRLDKGESGGGGASGEKKKKKKKKNADKTPGPSSSVACVEDPSASLNDIALGLLQNGPTASVGVKQNGKGSDGSSDKTSKKIPSSSKKPLKTDWFDNPPVEVLPSGGQASNDGTSKVEKAKESNENPQESAVDNFPSLHAMSTSVQHPKPPPGFHSDPPAAAASKTSTLSAPPGFSVPLPSAGRSVAAPPPGFLPTAVYMEPPNFKSRNMQLVQDIRSILATVEDGFSNFRALSGEFRQGFLEASDYYCSCQLLMGSTDFDNVFPELIALLPDVARQRELFDIHQAANQSGSSCSLRDCPTCGQIVLAQDVAHHQQVHGINPSDFPSLGGIGSKSDFGANNNGAERTAVKGAWIKAK
ncbi:E3 ubiquitin-protein ligase ZNF598 [Aplysia californica]|uniref:RING-type E3 ubiquitin transferase n=1 Tax=Aplysia californica TaxID=6500 RepID=A0ABM0K189_APLCA|nr:E3 ubiquitin-protein ligase ZNF598 [Aplysia californica]